jgi:hypothetical protein
MMLQPIFLYRLILGSTSKKNDELCATERYKETTRRYWLQLRTLMQERIVGSTVVIRGARGSGENISKDRIGRHLLDGRHVRNPVSARIRLHRREQRHSACYLWSCTAFHGLRVFGVERA